MSEFLRVMEAVEEVCDSIHNDGEAWVVLIEIDYDGNPGDSIHWRGWVGEL